MTITNVAGILRQSVLVDPFFANVVLLMHCNGANGNQSFVDVKGKTITAVGNAQHSTAQSKFDGSSLLMDGSGDRLTLADSDDWTISGQYTVEFFVRHVTKTTEQAYMGHWLSNSWFFYIESSQLKMRHSSGGSINDVVYSWVPTLNQWYHICVEKNSSNLVRLYIDGVMVASATYSSTIDNSNATFCIGSINGSFSAYDFNGYMDEIRITKGVARYNSNSGFSVPTAPFPNS